MSVRSTSPSGIRAEKENPVPCNNARLSQEEKSPDKLEGSKEEEDGTFAPIECPATHERGLQKQRSNASRSIERSWSLNDGVSTGGGDGLEGQEDVEAVSDGETGYVVGWEENDPMNPRNMSKARKWLIVIIVSTGSLCV